MILLSFLSVTAQDLACGEIVEDALWSIRQNCADLARDSLCYSHPSLDATFADESDAVDFSTPSHRAPLATLSRVKAKGLDLGSAHWGVALMNLGANFPQTYEGPGIIVLLAGDAEVINEVDPANVMEIGEPLSTAALVNTRRYKNPGVIPAAVGGLSADEILLVDAYDNTGDWLRVVTDGSVSWVRERRRGAPAGDGHAAQDRYRADISREGAHTIYRNRIPGM